MVDADYYKIVMNPQLGLFDPRFAATDEHPVQTPVWLGKVRVTVVPRPNSLSIVAEPP
jgi:hypothetical protein